MNEMDVLRAIYGDGNDEDSYNNYNVDNAAVAVALAVDACDESSSFHIVSPGNDELKRIRRILDLSIDNDEIDGGNDYDVLCTTTTTTTPEFQIEIRTRIDIDINKDIDKDKEAPLVVATLRCRLPSGYPEYAAAVVTSIRIMEHTSSLSLMMLNRSATDEIVLALNKKAAIKLLPDGDDGGGMGGTEAIMDLMEDAKELLSNHCRNTLLTNDGSKGKVIDACCNNNNNNNYYGRRWIWVHHITSSDRRKSIVREARELNLTGILKYGYPGVVLVEGPVASCDEFVMWIKGNKSRPGGFGRNWGHHVRGEINFDMLEEQVEETKVTTTTTTMFEEIEDLSTMSKSCKEMGLEDEFKEFVMQHNTKK